jgi:hypothetical protein
MAPVTYRVEFRPAAAQHTIGLPADAFVALVQALAFVSRDPFSEPATLATPDVHVRRVTFGDAGLASFYIDPAAHLVSVFAVTWIG